MRPLKFRGAVEHHVHCHMQDIPSNGADTAHFKYIHTYPTSLTQSIYYRWQLKWKLASDPDIGEMFEHPKKEFREHKQKIYEKLIKNYPRKETLSIANLENWVRLPFLG